MTSNERDELYRLLAGGIACAEISRRMGRDRSTIGREMRRNRKNGVGYLPDYACRQAAQRRYKGTYKLNQNPALKGLIIKLMRANKWSPAVIAGRILNENHTVTVCAETIYRYIYLSENGIKFQLYQLLPKQKVRRQKHRGRKNRIKIRDRVSIHKRPEIDGLGHFETDLILFGRSGKNLTSASDITSKLLVLKLNQSKHSKSVIINLEKTMRNNLITPKSFTFDNGLEFANHYLLNKKGYPTYFCDPYCSWQKPRVEHSNGLVRRYLPKNFNQHRLNDNLVESVQNIINLTPRKSLAFKTPLEVHFGLNLTLTKCCTSN